MSTIPPISTKITFHFNSLNDGQQFHQYQQTSPLTLTHWMMVNNSTNINKNHLSYQLIEWWSTISPISTKITSHFNSLSDVNNSTNINKNHLSPQLIGWNCWHHSMSWYERWFLLILVELFTIIQWVKVRGDVCWYWWNCWPSPNELRWEVIFVDIGGIVDVTQWVEVRGDFCWNWWNCWPSLNVLRWDVIFVDIGGIVDHHSMSLGERWFLLILVELLTIIQWVEVRGDFCWYWCNHWHHSMSWCERWFLLILVELLTITEWVKVRGDFCWYWWNCWPSLNVLRWEVIFVDIGDVNNSTNINKNHLSLQLIEWWSTIPPISIKITSHLNSLSDGKQFHQY